MNHAQSKMPRFPSVTIQVVALEQYVNGMLAYFGMDHTTFRPLPLRTKVAMTEYYDRLHPAKYDEVVQALRDTITSDVVTYGFMTDI